jgi:hypothetical protein
MQPLVDQTIKSYDQEYFSGAQVALFIGDIWVDEVSMFQMEVMQNKTPIYGYASELWDAISRGPKIVRGSFMINFKEAGYLFAVLNHYRKMGNKGSIFTSNKTQSNPHSEDYKGAVRANIEEMMDNKGTSGQYDRVLRDMAGFASTKQGNTKGLDSAEGLFEAFEDAIWGGQEKIDSFNFKNGVQSRSSTDYRLNGFDIYIQFGDYANGNNPNHTVIKLENVHLTGQSIAVALDGNPIQEAYTFLARNWV